MSLRSGDAAANAAAVAEPARDHDPSAMTSTLLARVALAIVWPPALVAGTYLLVGRLGFYPTDEGLVQEYAYRILHGEVPHRDFISPRPLGSAILHLVDFAIPGPLFEVARVISLAEYAAYALLFAWLIYDLVPWRWGLLAAMGAAGSMLVNLNIFPLMSWYTVDGLLLVAAGFVCVVRGVRSKSRTTVAAGFLLLGAAALTKQSFVPAPALGWVLLTPWLGELRWGTRLRSLLATGSLGALPSLAFVTAISAFGGFHALVTQLLGAGFVYGRALAAAWSPRHDLLVLGPVVGAAAGLLIVIEIAKRRREPGNQFLLLSARSGLSILVIALPLWARLGQLGGDWGIRVWWVLVATVVIGSLWDKSLDVVGFAIIGAAWMSSLSYGFALPNLAGGTAALFILHRTWSGSETALSLPRPLRPSFVAIGLLAFILTGYVFVQTRQQDVYLDRPSAQLTSTLGDVSPALGEIRTNPQTAEYLKEMAACVRSYPASSVAILPENAAMYPALSLRDPFPLDWIWPGDFNGSDSRLIAAADQMNRQGDYLVLFQTIGEPELVGGGSLPPATLQSQIHTYSGITNQIYARLGGQRSTCGTFLVVYSPPRG